MKKMMIIAALAGGMLMPAQIFAKENRGDKKPGVENRIEKNNKGNKKPQMNYKNSDKGKNNKKGYKDDYKYGKNKGNKKGNNHYAKQKPHKPYKPNVIVVNRPPHMPPPPPAKVIYESNPISAAASLVGLAALIAVIAD